MRGLYFSLALLLFSPLLSQQKIPDVVIVVSILRGGEDVGIAFSSLVSKGKVENYVKNLAKLSGGKVEVLNIRNEEDRTSAHFSLKGGKVFREDRQYLQLLINAFPDMHTLRIVLFPLRQIENSLPLHYENEDVIIRNLGMNTFNYEVMRKSETTTPVSLSSSWEKWRFFISSLLFLFSIGAFLMIWGRRRKKK